MQNIPKKEPEFLPEPEEELAKLALNNPDETQWFEFPEEFFRREAFVKPGCRLEVRAVEKTGDSIVVEPKAIPRGPPGRRWIFQTE